MPAKRCDSTSQTPVIEDGLKLHRLRVADELCCIARASGSKVLLERALGVGCRARTAVAGERPELGRRPCAEEE